MTHYIFIFIVFILLVGCNGQSDSVKDLVANEFTNLSPEKIYSGEDFNVSGLKINKSYDISELPKATSAIRTIFDSKYIEVRLYQTNADATNEGKIYAESITGPEAIVSGSSVMWKEKARDRRKCVPKAGLTEAGCQQVARYGGFIISGNLVLLCEGLDTIESHELCMNLIKQLNE